MAQAPARWGANAADAPLMPERVGRYEILLPIASGGMAKVYLARTRGTGGFEREVAVKLTHAHLRESQEFAAELIEEAKLSGRIRHPNVVPVLDAGDDPHGLFLVMDYVEGETLSGLARRSAAAGRPLAPSIGLRILCDALAGLHAAHELRDESGALLGLVHRDFSPQNILVGIDGMSRLADFGIAKAATRLSHTRTGNVKGKVAYMSPEQAKGQSIDRRCDVWAAGVVAWELLAGRRLFTGDNEVTLLLQIVGKAPPRLSEAGVTVPAELEQAVASALTTVAEARCPTAAELSRRILAACRVAGWTLGDVTEVGGCVQLLVGAKLATRRARAAEVLSLRARMGQTTALANEVLTPGSTGIPAAASAAPTSGRGASPAFPSPAWPVAVAEAPWASDPTAGPDSVPTMIRQPGAPPWDASSPMSLASERTGAPEQTGTDTASVTTGGRLDAFGGRDPALVRHRIVLTLGAAAVLAVGGMLGLWWSVSTPSEPATGAAADGLGPSSALPSAPAESADPASAAASAHSAPAPVMVLLKANAPINRAEVDGREVKAERPTAELSLELSAGEASRTLRLKVVSSDGRVALLQLNPGQKEAKIRFGPPAAGGSRTPPLADSPYKRK
jgi:serine/threonine protein kinase